MPPPLRSLAIMSIVSNICVEVPTINAFIPPVNVDVSSRWRLFVDAGDDAAGDANEDSGGNSGQRLRMSDVRAVQDIFYLSENETTSSSPWMDYNTGVFHNLPLWREKMGHTELPGRSLIGFIKDAVYTHMFETLLRGSDECRYFGQLRMDNNDVGINVNAASRGSSAQGGLPPRPQETDMKTPLHGWKDRSNDDGAVVVGTLMRIVDHIRLDDGRLMLLLHAVERFVVLEPRQLLPYPVADVMILPDEEELSEAGGSVAPAVRQSLLHWECYEYDDSIRFPITRQKGNDRVLPLSEVLFLGGGDALGSLLPFAPYRFSYLNNRCSSPVAGNTGSADAGGSLCPNLPELIECNVIREVNSFALDQKTNCNDLPQTVCIEVDLWVLIDEYVKLRGVSGVFPPHLLSLLPENIDWPDHFSLDKLASVHSGISLAEEGEHRQGNNRNLFSRVSDMSDYPGQRRQKRLSYACTALLGGPADDHPLLNRTMRRRLLEVPSTKGRLWAARELFEAYNSQLREK